MASTNQKRTAPTARTHEGAPAMARENPQAALKRVLNAHMLWEDTFYMDGESNADVLKQAVRAAAKDNDLVAQSTIIQARKAMNIRHASLLAAVELARVAESPLGRDTIFGVIDRVDELAEVVAMAGGKKLPHAVRKGVAMAFAKFDEYQFGKYKGIGKQFTLRDTVFITHPNPKDVPLVQKIVDGTLATPDTWEVGLSAGGDKRQVFSDLLHENKLGSMALLRNLRNMDKAGVDPLLIEAAFLEANWSRVLPFRFMAAALTAPRFAVLLDEAFKKAVSGSVFLPGRTAVMVDTSGSMNTTISEKSMVRAHWAGACLGAAVNGDHVDLFEWASRTRQVPNFRSLSTALSLRCGGVGQGTYLTRAMQTVGPNYDRYIILSDMQFGSAYGRVPAIPHGAKGYTINLRPYANPGIVQGSVVHLTGFSNAVLNYIAEIEG